MTVRAHVVDARGRSKVFRPLPAAERQAAVGRGLAAYARGAFYLAHEELEPAWMGTDDPSERELLAGLIKVAAAFVHAARGNPAGVRTNLRGARARLAAASAAAATAGEGAPVDITALVAAVDDRLRRLDALPDAAPAPGPDTHAAPGTAVPDPPHDVAGPPGRARRPPLDLEPPAVTWQATP